jgi:hypothetical protein
MRLEIAGRLGQDLRIQVAITTVTSNEYLS